MNSKSIFPVIIGALLVGSLSPAFANDAAVQQSAVQLLIARESSKYLTSHTAVSVVDASNAKLLHEKNGSVEFFPASTMKLVTAAVALETFGPDFHFTTNVTWNPEKHVLFLIGSGDPLLQTKQIGRAHV